MSESTGHILPSPTLAGLVECYSPSGQEAEAVTFLVEHMQELGYTRAFRDEAGNAVGVMGAGETQLVLLGHIDTVPGEIPVRVEGDLLYGRGAVDAKGPLAAFVVATAAVGPIPGYQIVVIGAVQEETDSSGAYYVSDQYQPALAIIGEPSRWDRVTLGYKGIHSVEILVRQTVRHGAAQDPTASELAVDLWNSIQEWEAECNADRPALFDQVSPRLRRIQGGSDDFEEWVRLDIQTRLPPGLLPEEWQAELEMLVGSAEVKIGEQPQAAYLGDKRNAVVRAFLGAIRGAGGKPGFVVKTGTADMNVVAPVWGCPMVAYGPGDSALDHTPNEHLSLTEYARGVDVLQGVLRRLTEKD